MSDLVIWGPRSAALTIHNRRGKFGQDYYTLRSIYLRGQSPPSVNMYWRKFEVKDIPLDDPTKFDLWMRERWIEKDALMEEYLVTGRFPASPSTGKDENGSFGGHIETEVKLAHWWEVGGIFVVLGAVALVCNLLARVWALVIYGRR